LLDLYLFSNIYSPSTDILPRYDKCTAVNISLRQYVHQRLSYTNTKASQQMETILDTLVNRCHT